MTVSFAERLAPLLKLAELAPGSALPENAEQLTNLLSIELDRPVAESLVEAWVDGRTLPSTAERRAIASCFGYADSATAYLDSDDPSVYMPYYNEVSAYAEVAGNHTGLVALRPLTNEPLPTAAVKDLGRLR